MARKSLTQQDLFMQWYPVGLSLAASSDDVVEAEFTTGLSIRGEYAWLIHRVEVYLQDAWTLVAGNRVMMALSVTQGEAVVPNLDDYGTIVVMEQVSMLAGASGLGTLVQPFIWPCLPPTIIASPKLSFYARTGTDQANLRTKKIVGRIGYTTVPIDSKMYLEIAETFETL